MLTKGPPTMLGGIGLLLFSALFIYFGCKGLLYDSQFDGTPQHVTGTIESVWWSGTGRTTGGFHAQFNYVTADGVEEHATASVMPDTFLRLHVGDEVPVIYFLQNPSLAWIDLPTEGKRLWWFEDVWFLLGAVVLIILALFTIQMTRPQSEKSWEDAAVDLKPFKRDEP
jgi:hypothetical protein